MLKDGLDLVASYPTWVKVAVALLSATILILIIVFRPPAQSGARAGTKSPVLRIDRIEAYDPVDLISLRVVINGRESRFPSGYDFARYDRNMSGGEYSLPRDAADFVVVIRGIAKQDERSFTLEMRQPIEFMLADIPRRGDTDLRYVENQQQQSPVLERRVRLDYSVF